MNLCGGETDESLLAFYMKYNKMRLQPKSPSTITNESIQNEIRPSTSSRINIESNNDSDVGPTVAERRIRKMNTPLIFGMLRAKHFLILLPDPPKPL